MTAYLFDMNDKPSRLRRIKTDCAQRILRTGGITLEESLEREALKLAHMAGLPTNVRTRALRLVKRINDRRK